MRILTLISEDFYFLSHRKELLLGLKKAGLDPILVTNITGPYRNITELNIPFHCLNIKRKSLSPLSVLRVALAYNRIIRVEKSDLVFAVALKPILAATLAGFLGARRPMLCAFAGLGTAFSEMSQMNWKILIIRKILNVALPLLLKHPTCYCLFQNSDDASLFLENRWTVRKNTYIINGAGVDLKLYKLREAGSQEKICFIFAGRLLWDKGIRELIEACKILKAKRLNFECAVAGLIDTANVFAVPVSVMEDADAGGFIKWLGPRKDIPELLRQADCFVFPSIYREGVPRVLLEASAAGLAIITTNMPGCREVVVDGETGVLIAPRDAVKLAAAMENFITNPGIMRKLGLNARKKAEAEFSVETVIDKHLAIFHDIKTRKPC